MLTTHWMLTTTLVKILKVKSDLQKLEDKIDNKIKALELDKKRFQRQIIALAQQNKETQQCYDELEQYGRRLWLTIDSALKQNNKKAEDVFKSAKDLLEEVSDLEIPEAVINRGHRLVLVIPTKVCKSVVVRFTIFRHRIAFYTAQGL